MNIETALTQAYRRLSASSDTPRLDAQVLLAHILEAPRTRLLAHPEAQLGGGQIQAFESALSRLEQGEPLPYILGRWEFYGLEFEVSPAVLIPRPETELLVENALDWLRRHPGKRLAADVGTGAGIIAVSLAVHIPDLTVLAVDISAPALQVARRNVARHAVAGQVELVQGHLLSATRRRFDLICANLPYIPARTLAGLKVSRWEPQTALYGGPDGLDLLRALIDQASYRLAPGGRLLLEIEAVQGPQVLKLARSAFPQGEARILTDLAGLDRLVVIDPDTLQEP